MLNRIFKKAARDDQRVHYRKAPGKGAALGVKLVCSNGAPVSGVLMDLSAGGVAIEFEDELSHELDVGVERQLVFSSLTAKSVRANAIVRMTPNERTPKRYGFEFSDGAALFEQLDDAFYKYFNRRQFRRAKPALGETVRAVFGFGNVAETVEIYDLSRGGASFYIPPDLVGHMAIDMPVEVSIKVPKTDHTLVNYAIVRHVTQDAKGYRVGVAMEPLQDAKGKRLNKKAFIAYTDYLQKRIAEMDSYNTAYN